MKVMLLDKSKMVNLILPNEVYGNYWITNALKDNLINVEAVEGSWIISSNADVKIYKDEEYIDKMELLKNTEFTIKNLETKIDYEVYISEIYNEKNLQLRFNTKDTFTFYIGNNTVEETSDLENWVSVNHSKMAKNQVQISFGSGKLYIRNMNQEIPMYVNNYLHKEGIIKYGDVIFILGFTFTVVADILMLLNPTDNVKYDVSKFVIEPKVELDYSVIDELVDSHIDVFEKKDFYLRPPRFSERVENKTIVIDAPPGEFKDESLPMFLTMGPMVVMGMSSCVTGVLALMRVMSGESTLKDSISSIITAFCMIGAMIVFPSITKWYNKRLKRKKEKKRQELYGQYLIEKEGEIDKELQSQIRILTDTNLSLQNVADVITYKKRNLWERMKNHPDFLELRMGIGSIKPQITLKSPEEHFTLEEDNLKQEIFRLNEKIEQIDNVPVTLSLKNKYLTAIIGSPEINRNFIDGLILQMVAYHSWVDLKIVIITNDESNGKWEQYKNLPYCWNDERNFRFFGTNQDDVSKVSSFLEEQFASRKQAMAASQDKKIGFDKIYLIITDDIEGSRNISIIDEILKSPYYLGMSILFSTDKLNALPNEVSTFVNISQNDGGIFENELISNKRTSFKPDFLTFPLEPLLYTVSNIPIDLNDGKYELPTVLSFLEMFGASNVKQLNSFNKWKSNDPTKSLSAPIGVNQNGDLFKLDLHEKFHGPHGLVAGMTGSGKSEFIISYILSMAVNYHPHEVNFVLIDYKGGGLAGAFENKETGVKLPHLAGTITNLDVGEINRSLSSLQSELKRRQALFNEARDKVGESTIDIYKYQKLFREGKVSEPIPHLFIISDEFAELKAQQPAFMTQLISTARIGRSLGVHLILATQKPSGVVDDQIWSNSKFRVCLKVQDKSDSNDMIKSPAAAMIKETGRFYLQVGYNEFFAMGQSAWCGAPYYESDKRRKKVDTSIEFVDYVGSPIKNISNDKGTDNGVRKGEELPNILNYLIETVKMEPVNVKRLWLDRIPEYIYVDNLKEKYSYTKNEFELDILLGEYDAPNKQMQGLLTLPISKNGNALIYGMVGSGKDNLIITLIYSLITNYSVDEVNIYALDFGAETLRLFKNAPQIGGLTFSNDKDKISNLFKLMKKTIETRKKLFIDYNGSYETYIKTSNQTLPNVVLFVNNFEAFNDTYGVTHFDDLVSITREGPKYGVYVIATVSGSNGMRSKLSQNFGQQLTLQMSDDFDYRSIIGRTEIYPSKIMGRGLVNLDNIYEFQTAYISDNESLSQKIKKTCDDLNNKYSGAAIRIPELPDTVTTMFVKSEFKGLSQVPVGVEKDTLNVRTINIKSSPSLMISSMNVNSTKSFVASLLSELSILKRTMILVFDAERILKDEKIINNVKYYNSSFEKCLEGYGSIVNKLNDIYINSDFDIESISGYEDVICVFIGIDKLKTILGDKFLTLFANNIDVSKKLQKFNYVFVDSVDILKKMEYDGWYKSVVNSTRGIWIGNGIAEQALFRLTVSTRNLPNILNKGFGYDILGGNPCLIKYVESYETDEEYDTL